MNPALLLVLLLAGTLVLLLGTLSAVFGWLPLVPALVLAGIGAAVETFAALAFARSRRNPHRGRAQGTMTRPAYQHTQAGWPMRLSFTALALGLVVVCAFPPPGLGSGSLWAMVVGAVVALAVGWLCSSLTVCVDGNALRFHFGFGWPRKAVPMDDIVAVEVTRTTFWEGWGVHRTRRGWLYNVSGYDAVLIRRRDDSSLLVGTDEPRRLKAAIERAQGRT